MYENTGYSTAPYHFANVKFNYWQKDSDKRTNSANLEIEPRLVSAGSFSKQFKAKNINESMSFEDSIASGTLFAR